MTRQRLFDFDRRPSLSQSAQPAGKPPNIIFIMADDHAAHAISAYGSRINQTPNIDRIAHEGVRFDNCFCTNSICTPSRARDPDRPVQPHERRLHAERRLDPAAQQCRQAAAGGRAIRRR